MRSLVSPVCYHGVCKLEVPIICFIPLFLSTQNDKKFCSILKGLTELLVEVFLSAEPQKSSHHYQIFVLDWCNRKTLPQSKTQTTRESLESKSKNSSLGSR